MSDGMQIRDDSFSNRVQEFLRSSGYMQKELADEIGLNSKVLSRKLNGNGNAHLTHLEIRNILIALTHWHAITNQDEAIRLLELAEVGPTLFSDEEWRTPPLNQLQAQRTQHTLVGNESNSVPTRSILHNLPAPTTRFIGREWAVERLRYLFGRNDIRLVTLVGLGGSGKTRLALHIAHELVNIFEQGVWFVSLAGVNDPTLVPMSIVQALNIKLSRGVSPLQGLCAYIRNKHLLLVLDNFEQVSDAASTIHEMLSAAPGLKVLVTSRSVLHISGEHPLGIPTLDIPDINVTLKATELAHFEAIQLFVEAAQAVVPNFALTEENKVIITQICAKVEGLPLALELAAARMNVLSPPLLLERLSKARLTMLTGGARNLPGRQQTLRNTIIWSYDLLSPVVQMWFSRLGIFSGGWSLDAAEAMAQPGITDREDISASDAMLDVIGQLVDNSLLVHSPGANEQPRFTMLETLREFAKETLTARGELEQWQDWHACYFLHLAEAAELGLRGPEQLVWLERLGADRGNLRSALEWLLLRAKAGMRISIPTFLKQADTEYNYREVAGSGTLSSHTVPTSGRLALEVCLRLAAALRPYWEWQGYLTEGRDWLRASLSIPLETMQEEGKEDEQTMLAARAKALSEFSRLMCLQNEQETARELAEQSLVLWQQLNDPIGIATVLLHRGWVYQAIDENKEAERVYQEGLQHLSDTNDMWLRAQLLCYLGATAGFTFDFEAMRSYYKQSRELFEQVGDSCALADVLKDQGGFLILESNYDEAIACLLQSITLCKELDQKQYITTGMGWLAIAVGMRGEPDPHTASIRAARLKGAVQGLMDTVGISPWTKTHPLIQAINLHIGSQTDEASWKAAWESGRKLTFEQAIALAHRLGEW